MNEQNIQPDLNEEIKNVRELLNRATKNTLSGDTSNLKNLDVRIKNLSSRLLAEINTLNEEERDTLLSDLKGMVDEITILERSYLKPAPKAAQTDINSTKEGHDE